MSTPEGYVFVDPNTLAPAGPPAAPAPAGAAPPPAPAPAPGQQAGGYEFVDSSKLPGATWHDRLQAGEAGILRGGAYLTGMIPDAAANLANLGRAAAGIAYLATGHKPSEMPSWLDPAGDPTFQANPVGGGIAHVMDQSPVTTTQVARPDDAASRYLATATSVIPAIATGSEGSIPNVLAQGARGSAIAAVPAMAGQYVAERAPFGDNEAANNAASILAQSLAAGVPGVVRTTSAAVTPKNELLQRTQEAGYVTPPVVTNPTVANQITNRLAGRGYLPTHAAIENQAVTDTLGRRDLGLTGEGPVLPSDLAKIRKESNAAYAAVKSQGDLLPPDKYFEPELNAAMSKFSGASKLSTALGKNDLDPIVADLKAGNNFNASNAMDAIEVLRDKSKQAYANGDKGNGAAYKGVATAIENQIDRSLAATGKGDLVPAYQAARQKLAIAHTVEDVQVPGSYNIDAQKLARKLANDEQLPANLRIAAEGASVVPGAFAVPKAAPSGGGLHVGALGSMFAAHELASSFLPPEMAHLATAAVPAIYFGAKGGSALSRAYALSGAGQKAALEQGPAQVNAARLAAQLQAAAAR